MPPDLAAAAVPIILGVAPNGSRRGKADHPHLPISPEALAQCAREVVAAGASLMHLHVRDDHGGHSLDAWRYRRALQEIRDAVGDQLVLQVTSEAGGVYTREQQMSAMRAMAPESVSLALRELCPGEEHENEYRDFCQELLDRGVLVQHILHEPAEVLRFERLRGLGLLAEQRPFALFVLGRHAAGGDAPPQELMEFLRQVPKPRFRWAVCAFGRQEPVACLLAARRGGHCRVGFENNLWLADGSLAPNNAALLQQIVPGLAALGRRPATAAETRAILRAA